MIAVITSVQSIHISLRGIWGHAPQKNFGTTRLNLVALLQKYCQLNLSGTTYVQ